MTTRSLSLVLAASWLLVTGISGKQLPIEKIIQSGPENYAGYVGESVWFNCTVQPGDRQQWQEYVTNPTGALISDGTTLLPNHPNYARFQIDADVSSGRFDLMLMDTVGNDGGRYECFETTTSSSMASEYVAIERTANCTSPLPPDGVVIKDVYYTIECTLYFGASDGIWPLMTWTGPGNFQQLYTQFPDSVFSGVSFNVEKAMDGGRFHMLVNFTDEGFGGPNRAGNVPTFVEHFYSQVLTVHYGPESVSYSPVLPSYEIGMTLTCSADAAPDATYVWTNMATLEEFPGATVTITADMVGQTVLRCQVVNIVSTANIFANITVNPITTTGSTTTAPSTTTVPAVSNCLDLTGRWEHVRSPTSKAVLCLTIDGAENGYLSGLLWNDTETETYYMEIMGRTRNNIYDETGFTGIWPLSVGISAFAAECHRCYGEETLLVNAISRSSDESTYCDDFGTVMESVQYDFRRVPPSYPCSSGTTWAEMKAISRQAAERRRRRMAERYH